jgi:hypothetical protein
MARYKEYRIVQLPVQKNPPEAEILRPTVGSVSQNIVFRYEEIR